MSKSEQVSSGTPLTTILFVVFLVLKLTGTIGWSWWWVFAPIWAPAAFMLTGLAFVAIIAALATKKR